ncbi:ribosomal protein S10p/S20e, putative [Trichomonas vaginalis G3]|uniref:Small ribosomal subunit protein uS10 n=1 Tax=Trichomonas vaginalis (strain ATCC PRA-98 / G3) TaxID=412133 RepID=A2EK65_TRIV3|nr:Chain U Ribosomal Protein S10p/S20e [Trichomonas vaginalis G3]EAY06958.1 ribosomal protein S10p/S20e, putative [Trichomonas vaginalis G3]KAI5499109.1 Chain U Ribosomal Protein S10p/S20e [Trichomonas vaginalis G3]|eukprot:XP_001319181.1 ribosomal protein S10p/S20e [Trichomonas vaginalis G3]
MADRVVPTGDEKKEIVEDLPVQKIRLTITSSKLPNLQRVVGNLMGKLKKGNLEVRGPIPMPRRRLRITTRRAPCGNGTETYDHFELRIYKRVIDFQGTAEAVKQVTQIALEPDVHVEVSVITE